MTLIRFVRNYQDESTDRDFLGGAADVGRHIHSAAWERAHDGAYTEAVEQIKPHFRQCPRCSQWVCVDQCWNEKRGLCKECAPDLAVEMSHMQAEAAIQDAQQVAHAAASEEVTAEDFNEAIRAVCPRCGAPASASSAQSAALLSPPKSSAQSAVRRLPPEPSSAPNAGRIRHN